MLEFDNIRLDLESYEVPVAELKDALHIDRVSDQISEYENRMQEPDFWNNVEKATEIQQTLGRLKKKVESYNALVAEKEELESELQPLKQFKLDTERIQKQEMIDKTFYMLSQEDKKDVKFENEIEKNKKTKSKNIKKKV